MKKKWIFGAAAAVLIIFSLLMTGFFLHAQAEYRPPGESRTPKTLRAHIAPDGSGYKMNPSQHILLKKTDAPPPKTAIVKKTKKSTSKTTKNKPRSPSVKNPSSPNAQTRNRSSAAPATARGTSNARDPSTANNPSNASAAGSAKNSRSGSKNHGSRRAGGHNPAHPAKKQTKNKNHRGKDPGSRKNPGGSSSSGKKRTGSPDQKNPGKKSDSSKQKKRGGKSDSPDKEQPDDGRPIITTSLMNGQKVDGTTLLFSVSAKDADGNTISAFDITVTLNGTRITTVSNSTYRPENLKNGKNTIKITAADNNGNCRTITRTVNCNASAEAKITGTATVRIEAKTLSLGNNGIISSGKVPVHQSDMVSDVVLSYLAKNRFTYEYTNGYLASISKPGIAAGAKVPETLLKAANAEDPFAGGKTYSDATLAEKQFTSQSGWMFSVNDSFPEKRGMSGVSAKAKQKIRLCYTLFGNGADVDGRIKW